MTKTVNYDNDANIDDLAMVGYNSNTEINLQTKRHHQPALCNSEQKVNQKTKKTKDDDFIFVKQVPLHPRERLARGTRKQKDEDVIFVKQVPLHPRRS